MKNILITTDFSHHSKHTIKYVLEMLRNIHIPCRILLLNTYMVLQTDAKQVISLNDELKIKSKTGLLKEVEQALNQNQNPNISVEAISHMGSLKNVVYQVLKNEKIDLVAMGKDGGNHVEAISTLLKEERCPLLITFDGED